LKVKIETVSQEEFDSKRESLLKSLAGDKFDIVRKATVYKLQKPAIEERAGYYKAQDEMQEHLNNVWKREMAEMKKEIEKVLEA
jgi:hypothetical protein